jgi:amino acid transporter
MLFIIWIVGVVLSLLFFGLIAALISDFRFLTIIGIAIGAAVWPLLLLFMIAVLVFRKFHEVAEKSKRRDVVK